MILYYFNPVVDLLRGVRQFTTLAKVQRLWGVKPTSLGSLSEAARVFDPLALEPIIAELAAQSNAISAISRKKTTRPNDSCANSIGERVCVSNLGEIWREAHAAEH